MAIRSLWLPAIIAGAVAVFAQNRLTLRGVPGKTRLLAMGRAAEGKGILVLRGKQVLVEGIEFRGARVPDRNGSGIRFEQGSLTVRNCRFLENENGILTASNPGMTLTIENSEFGHNGAGDGQSHNLYGRRDRPPDSFGGAIFTMRRSAIC